jgi:cell shape-determining protein MreC
MEDRVTRSSGRTMFWLLVSAAAAAALLAPEGLSRPLRGGFQWLAAPGHRLGHGLTLAVSDQVDRIQEAGLSAEQAEALRDQNEQLKQAMLALSAERDALRREQQQLLRLPDAVRRDAVHIIPAALYGRDVAALRDAANLSEGTNRNVEPGRWVTTLRFVDRGAAEEIKQHLPILAGAQLVGQIDQVYFRQSRVRLITDIESRVQGQIYHRLDGGGYQGGPTCLVEGAGGGRMTIPRMEVQASAPIREGDCVVTRAGEPMLPPNVSIGTVTLCRPRRDNPLLYEIEVTPLAALGALDAVMVVEMGPAPAPKK